MKNKWYWVNALYAGISRLSAMSAVLARAMLLALILSGLMTPLAAVVRQESQPTPPYLRQMDMQQHPQAVNQCAYFFAVTDWTAILHFSWQDAASGLIEGYPANATIMRYATVRQRLTLQGGDPSSTRWTSSGPGSQPSTGDIQVNDVKQVNWPFGSETSSTTGFGSPNGDNLNHAVLDIYSDCTYNLGFGIDGDVVNKSGNGQFQGSLLLGYVHLSRLAISEPVPGLILHGSMDVPYQPLASTGTYFSAGYDEGLNGILDIRGKTNTVADATVSWSLIPGNVPPCARRIGPIDASDPALDDPKIRLNVDQDTIPPNKGDTLNPPDPANLTVKVTCTGMPVKNAQVKIEVNAKKTSGGHFHSSANAPRPRGYLKGPGAANYTELTEQNKSITVQTDSMGIAKVTFRPGTDYATGGVGACAGKQRGIAGIYEVTASLVDTRFKGRQAQSAIHVKRTDFVPLPPAGSHYVRRYSSSIHPEGTWGTQPTMGGVQALANRFHDYQVQHNQVLSQSGKVVWPIVDLGIIDISLQDGGLFDSGGTNVCGGGKRVGFFPWQIPHQTHLKGTGVDISTNAVTWPGSQARRDWWKSALRGLGCFYGTWAEEGTLHLDVDQNANNWGQLHPGCRFPLPPAAVLQSSSPSFQTDAPILFVSVIPGTLGEDTYEPPIAAPGQVLTFTIGVNNLSSTSDAHQVVLTATLPNGLQFVNADPPASRMGGANQPIWDIGMLNTQASLQTFSLAVQVDSGITPGTILTMTAQATTSDSGPTLDDHFDEAVLVQPLGPDLAVQAQDLEGAAMTIDRPITTTFSVVNQGTTAASSVRLTLTLPPSVTLQSALPPTLTTTMNTVTWDLGLLASDASQRISVTLNVDPALTTWIAPDPDLETGNLLTFTLNAATPGDIDLTNNTQTVAKLVAFAGNDTAIWIDTQEADAEAPAVGQAITYTILYSNLGNQVASATMVTMTLGAGQSIFDVVPTPTNVVSGTVLGWNLGDLPTGAEGNFQIHAHVDAVPPEGSLTYATIESAGFDIAPSNNVAMDLRIESRKSYAVYLPLVMVSSHGGPAPTATPTPTPPLHVTSTPTPTATAGTPHPLFPGFGLRQSTAMRTATPAAP